MKNGLEITLSSSTPYIREHDAQNNLGFGVFFDEMAKIGCPCTLHAPSEEVMRQGDPNPFRVSSLKGFLHKRTAVYDGICARGESITQATKNFVALVLLKSQQGYRICKGSNPLHQYQLKLAERTVTLEPYVPAPHC